MSSPTPPASSNPAALAHHFDDLKQQETSARLGMWLFLCTEVLLFGAAFMGYAVYRSIYPEAWAAGSHHNDLILGTINTGVLLISSLTMALAVHAAEENAWRLSAYFLAGTIALGSLFLGIKFYEYYAHYAEGYAPGVRYLAEGPDAPQMELFFIFYFAMTGLHAVHMLIGIGLAAVMAVLAWREALPYYVPVEMTGLYWHLVDIVWVFLFPLLYLVG